MDRAQHRIAELGQADRDRIQRLQGALTKTLQTFLAQEEARSAVVATACGHFVAQTFAELSVRGADTIDSARGRLDLALDAFKTSFWHAFQRLKGEES